MAGGAKSAAKAPKSAGTADRGGDAPERPLRPSQCRGYMRQKLSEEFRGIVEGFVKSAREGSCQHVKLATELLEAPASRRVRSRRKGTAQRLLEEFERESR